VETIRYAVEKQRSPTDINADALQVRCSQNRSAEFEAITLPNLRALHGKARHLLKDPSAADDMVQETCLRAWQNFDQFTPGTNGRAWLFAILMNVVKHEYRRRGRWRIDPQSPEILENCFAPTCRNAEVLTDQHLLVAIEGMPLHFRQVLVLAVVSELQYHEIAETLHIPIGTVMSRLSRARAHLRSVFMGSSGIHGTKDAAICIRRISVDPNSDIFEARDETLVA
jgi:RNA polymerase sigma-70 factor (ECF subfamily)